MNVASSSSAFDTPFCAAKLLLHCSGTMVAVASRLKFQHREEKLGPLSSLDPLLHISDNAFDVLLSVREIQRLFSVSFKEVSY